MRKSLEERYGRQVANMIKMDSNHMESDVQVDLVRHIEEGRVEVVGMVDGQLLYQESSESVEMLEGIVI